MRQLTSTCATRKYEGERKHAGASLEIERSEVIDRHHTTDQPAGDVATLCPVPSEHSCSQRLNSQICICVSMLVKISRDWLGRVDKLTYLDWLAMFMHSLGDWRRGRIPSPSSVHW